MLTGKAGFNSKTAKVGLKVLACGIQTKSRFSGRVIFLRCLPKKGVNNLSKDVHKLIKSVEMTKQTRNEIMITQPLSPADKKDKYHNSITSQTLSDGEFRNRGLQVFKFSKKNVNNNVE